MRIGGLASGMDTDSMVKELMKAQRMPLDKLIQKRQLIDWQRQDYLSIKSSLMEFRNILFNMKLQTTYAAKQASVSDSSAISVSASSSAAEGIYKISVENLAKSASLTSGDVVTGTATGTGSTTLGSLGLTADTFLTIGGEKGTATVQVKSTDTIDNFVNAVNTQSGITGATLSYDSTLDTFFFVSTTTGANAKVDLKSSDFATSKYLITDVLKFSATGTVNGEVVRASGTQTFTNTTDFVDSTLTTSQTLRIGDGTNTYDFTINSTTTVGQVLSAINSSDLGKAGVSAYLENGKIVLSSADTSKTFSFQNVTGNSSDIVTKLGLDGTITETPTTYKQSLSNGANAKVIFNNVTGEYATNSFSINGIGVTLKKAQPGVNLDITVTRDNDSIFNTIKGFVDKYNDTIDKINTKINEARFSNFQPLTDEQKSAMKDNDVTNWEAKAKSGLLRNDSILTAAVNGFRSSLYQDVQGLPAGDFKQLTEIGITTGPYSERGKLHIDEAKLRDAITKDPNQVMRLFTANDGNTATNSGDGLAVRLADQIDSISKQITDKAGIYAGTFTKDESILGKSVGTLNIEIDDFNNRLVDIENRYYQQFAAMEKAINQMNSQSGWLAQQFG